MSIVLRSRKTLAQRYRGVLKKYGTLSHLWDFGVAAGPLAYAATHTAAEFLAQYPNWHLYQDTEGTVPACKITDPVGLCLDTGSGSVVLGPELFLGAYLPGAATTATYSAGEATATLGGRLVSTGNNWLSFPGNSVANVMSVIEFDAQWVSGGDLECGRGYAVGLRVTASSNGGLKKRYTARALDSYSSEGSGRATFGTPTAGSVWKITIISVREVIGAHASQTTPTKRAILDAAGSSVSDGIDDVLTTTTGGASSTAAFLCVAFNTSRSGSAQTLWSDRTGNAGLKLEITAANALVLSGGTGSAIVTATGGTVAASAPHIATVKYDGTTLSVQLDNGTVATAACALSTGTAAITVGMDNGAVTAPYKGVLRQCTYIKDSLPTTGEQLLIRQATAASIGVVL